ncbi:UNVERIFIED_CONTAM: hypothetical protein Sangu_2552000 [Sesamum angustifolium]|uniref:Uncharacterized protein n=1 Tax=Sesamum angustifolium TaxID=2727405 RepID=A0AAW2J8C2_9LAMI
MAFTDELVRFVRETLLGKTLQGYFEEMGPGLFEPASGRRWSLRQAVVAAYRLLDEPSDEEERENEEEGSFLGEEDREVA